MSIKLDKDTLQRVLSDKEYEQELIELLNSAIDSELLKSDDEIDLEYIDECVDILNAIQDGELESVIEKLSEEEKTEETKSNVIKFEQEKKPTTRKVVRLRRIIAVAAIIMIAGTITLQAFPAIADNVKSFFVYVTERLWDVADKSDDGLNEVFGIEIEFPEEYPDEIKTLYDADQFIAECKVFAFDSEGVRSEVSIDDCIVEKEMQTNSKGETVILVEIGYRGVGDTFTISVDE